FDLNPRLFIPLFFDFFSFVSRSPLQHLFVFYADALDASGLPCDCLFGPAYKGIPLVVATAVAMAGHYGKDLPYAFNRKEVKDHGEGGWLVGAEPAGNVVIVDDVVTAGTAIREMMPLLAKTSAELAGILIAIDRQEKGRGELSAVQEVEGEYGVKVVSILTLDNIVEYLSFEGGFQQELVRVREYQDVYGV
ncbi:MAG: orotate phosphoribosyltransferase, partial [Pseudomonadales bacterium]